MKLFGSDSARALDALQKSFAMIEFDPNGTIISANDAFCSLLGYGASDIVGKHHRIFVEPAYAGSAEYKEFWNKLGAGVFDAGEYKRIGAGGREVWIQASYNPVLSRSGKVLKVLKVAMDVTATKMQAAENKGKMDAISRAQAVIEFNTDGTVITANENFLQALGYRLEEIRGKHHSMFVGADYRQSAEYAEFWRRLNSGEFIAQEFQRFGKGGREVWIQASYNPIFDINGKIMKVVKFATDVTGRVNSVNGIATGLQHLANGDLTYRIENTFTPELDMLRTNFNASIQSLQDALKNISASAKGIEAGSGEITIAADDLSRRTEQQASSLEETTAALSELAGTVKKSADGTDHARTVVSAAKEEADRSNSVVAAAQRAMAGIEQSSEQIGQIIGLIDEIAFQTNLLALNAGVEAARAGDAGRGFAVVASEVRSLAQRAADAAKQIKQLITASDGQVQEGVKLVADAGSALDRIASQVVQINEIVAGIASSAREQANGIDQINIAVVQMDQFTQQNAAMVEESTAASHSLASEAASLNELISRYKIYENGMAAVAPRKARSNTVVKIDTSTHKSKSIGSSVKAGVRAPMKAVANGYAHSEEWAEF